MHFPCGADADSRGIRDGIRIADFRHLVQVININFRDCIKEQISCPATMSGAEALRRAIKKGTFDMEAVDGYWDADLGIRQISASEFVAVDEDEEEPQPQPKPKPQPQPIQQPDIASALSALQALFPQQQGISAEDVRAIVAEQIATLMSAGALYRGIEIRQPAVPSIRIEGQFHEKFDSLLKCLTIRQSCFLYGPAGTSKTTSVRKASEVLNLPFIPEVVGLTSSKTDFLGFFDAGGRVTSPNFRKAFLGGGVYFIDEADSANANVGIALNTAIENRICTFPDGVHEAHPDFVVVAAGNTNGRGATSGFGGRVRMDGAFADRFAFIYWGVDERLESAICADPAWAKKVRKIRKVVADLGMADEIAVTPRVSIKGAGLLSAGFTEAEVLEMLLFRGAVSEDVKTQIFARL